MLQKAEEDLQAARANVSLTEAEIERARLANVAAIEQLTHMEATCEWLRQLLRDHPEEPVGTQTAEPKSAPAGEQAASSPVQGRDEAPAPVPVLFGKPVPEVTQTDLCLYALERLDRPVTTKEIREFLQKEDHQFSQAQVRSTLKYLANRRKPSLVESTQPGVWRLRRVDTAVPFDTAS
jgi:hypothetical protein